ncbi:hypothetical protein D3C81_1552130 [compost metagenome]
MKFAITAGAGKGACVEHFVARLKQRHFSPDLADNTGGIPAEDFRFFGESSGAYFGIDRIDRHRTNFYEQIPGAGSWHRKVDVLQRLRIFNGQSVLGEGDGFHGNSLSEELMCSLAAIFDFPSTKKNQQNAPTLSLQE